MILDDVQSKRTDLKFIEKEDMTWACSAFPPHHNISPELLTAKILLSQISNAVCFRLSWSINLQLALKRGEAVSAGATRAMF